MTTSGCFSPYHNSQLLVFRRRGLLTQCGRALPQPCIRARVLWISIKIEGGQDRGGGRKDRKRTCDRISDISFPERVLLRDTARSWRDQRERFCPNDRLRRKTTRGIILSFSIYLSVSVVVEIKSRRYPWRVSWRRNSNADPAPPTVLHCLRPIRVRIRIYSLSRLSYSLHAEKRLSNDRLITSRFISWFIRDRNCEPRILDFVSNC